MKITVSSTFYPLLKDEHRYLVLCGGRGSGKSEFAGRKIFFRCERDGGHRFLVLRKIRKTCKESVVEVMRRILNENNVPYLYNKTDRIISMRNVYGKTSEILFDGLDEPEKIKSIKGLTGVWVEEATEFTERDFMEVDLAFREPGPSYKQIILSFNPDEALAPWLKVRFFDRANDDAMVHVSTVDDNPIPEIRGEYKRRLEEIQDETYRAIYLHGMWARPRGKIYSWDACPLPAIKFDEIFYGGDFGYSIDPAALVKIYRKANEFWLEELIYRTGLTNQDLAAEAIGLDPGVKDDPSYWDSAEPKSIEELYRAGLNAKGASKGPDSVRAGIDFLKSQIIHIVLGSENIIREAARYKWREDKWGNVIPEPEHFFDHTMKAACYGIHTHMRQADGGDAVIVERDVSPD